MAAQARGNIFGCSSSHGTQATMGKESILSPDAFLELDEIKRYLIEHPEAISVVNGEVYLNEFLTFRYLHLCGNKRLKKAFKKASKGAV